MIAKSPRPPCSSRNEAPLPWPVFQRCTCGEGRLLVGIPPAPSPTSTSPRSGTSARATASAALTTQVANPFGLTAPSPTT